MGSSEKTFHGNRPKEWGISGLTPIPKKEDVTKTDNYHYNLHFISYNKLSILKAFRWGLI